MRQFDCNVGWYRAIRWDKNLVSTIVMSHEKILASIHTQDVEKMRNWCIDRQHELEWRLLCKVPSHALGNCGTATATAEAKLGKLDGVLNDTILRVYPSTLF